MTSAPSNDRRSSKTGNTDDVDADLEVDIEIISSCPASSSSK